MPESDASHAAQPKRSAIRTIARNTIWGISAQFALKGANFLFSVLIVRTLGGEQFGQYWIVLAWTGLFSVIGDLGITQYLTREIARDGRRTEELFWDTVFLRLVLAILCTAITVGAAIALTNYSSEIIWGMLIFCLTYFFQIIIAPLNSILVGNERIDIASALNVVMQVLWMIFSGLFLVLGLGFDWILIAGVINLPIVLALQIWFVRRNQLSPPRFRLNRALWWSVIKAGLPFGFTQLALSFAFRVDTIVLSSYVTEYEVGLYNVAYNLVLTLHGLNSSFGQAIMPTLAREHARDPQSILPWYYRSVKLLLFLGLPVAVGGMVTAGHIVGFLYQPEIAPAAVALAILIWDLPFVMYHSFCGQIANSITREGSAARIYITLGIFNLGLNLLLVPRLGIIGAAFATVTTDLLGAALYYLMYRRTFGAGLGLNRLIRIPAAAGIMGVLAYALRDQHLFLIIPTAGAAYLALVWALRVFSLQEREQFVGLIQRRLRLKPAA